MESIVEAMPKIVCVIVKEGGPTGPPLGLKRIKYTLGPLGLKQVLITTEITICSAIFIW